ANPTMTRITRRMMRTAPQPIPNFFISDSNPSERRGRAISLSRGFRKQAAKSIPRGSGVARLELRGRLRRFCGHDGFCGAGGRQIPASKLLGIRKLAEIAQ